MDGTIRVAAPGDSRQQRVLAEAAAAPFETVSNRCGEALLPGSRESLQRLRWFGDAVGHAVDGALPLDGDVGLDALDNSHIEVTEVLDLVLDHKAGGVLALTLLPANALRLALFAHLRLAVHLCERRLLLASQG
jgi:hypothetical protein